MTARQSKVNPSCKCMFPCFIKEKGTHDCYAFDLEQYRSTDYCNTTVAYVGSTVYDSLCSSSRQGICRGNHMIL